MKKIINKINLCYVILLCTEYWPYDCSRMNDEIKRVRLELYSLFDPHGESFKLALLWLHSYLFIFKSENCFRVFFFKCHIPRAKLLTPMYIFPFGFDVMDE